MIDYIKSLRQHSGPAPILQCGASVILVGVDGKILLQRRRDNGYWGYHGGAVELDEVVEDAAKRELFEETGLTANSLELFGVFSGADMHYVYPNGDEVSNVDIVYICREYSGELKAEPCEVTELRFFAIDELPDNISPPQRKPLSEYVSRDKTARANRVLVNWSIPQALPVTHLANSVWSIGEEYILKLGKRDWIERSIALTKALAKQGAMVGGPVAAKAETDYVDAQDGENIWALFRAVKGEPLPTAERFGERRSEYAFKFGEAIAELHKALAGIDAPDNIADVDLYQHVTEWAIPKANVSEEIVRDYTDNFLSLSSELPRQLIHRDTHPENILWLGGNISGFIDFDIAQRNARLWDVCYCSTALLSDCPLNERDKWFDVLEGLLRGYDSVSPLTDAERQAVYYVICSVQLVFIAWCEPESEMAKLNREMLEFIASNKERIKAINLA